MDAWLLLFVSLSVCFALKTLFSFFKNTSNRSLPPGPFSLPILGSTILLGKSLWDLETVLHRLRKKFGPIFTLYIGPRPTVFISDRTLAMQVLVLKGAASADRPPPLPHDRILSSNQHNISSAGYGPLWRLFRRNIASEVLHPSRVKQFAPSRELVLHELSCNLRSQADGGHPVMVIESFHDAMFSLMVTMCFGGEPDHVVIKQIEDVQKFLLTRFDKFVIFAILPWITKLLFRKRWNELLAIRKKLEQIFIPLIRERKHNRRSDICCYVDSLLRLQLDGSKNLTECEIVSLCSEFLVAGIDSTTTALQWVMANLVRRQDVQAKLVEEIKTVLGSDFGTEIKEEDTQNMPYLKALILEVLRLHPPTHLLLPHAVSEAMNIGGYMIPKNTSVNFMVGEINRNGEVWVEPTEFRPERFLAGYPSERVDITGSREIKMMPFGAGRRICPGLGLAILHLEYFVVNLVRQFEWKAVEGEEVDMSEKLEFTTVMLNPLRARILPRDLKNC